MYVSILQYQYSDLPQIENAYWQLQRKREGQKEGKLSLQLNWKTCFREVWFLFFVVCFFLSSFFLCFFSLWLEQGRIWVDGVDGWRQRGLNRGEKKILRGRAYEEICVAGAETSFSVSSLISANFQDVEGTLLMVSKASQKSTKRAQTEQSKFHGRRHGSTSFFFVEYFYLIRIMRSQKSSTVHECTQGLYTGGGVDCVTLPPSFSPAFSISFTSTTLDLLLFFPPTLALSPSLSSARPCGAYDEKEAHPTKSHISTLVSSLAYSSVHSFSCSLSYASLISSSLFSL